MKEIIHILTNQQEVKYLTYFLYLDKNDEIIAEFSAAGVTKKYKFTDESACLNKLIDILFEIKKLESWMLKREDKRNDKR